MSNSVNATRPVSFTAPAQGEAARTRPSTSAKEGMTEPAKTDTGSAERKPTQSEPVNQREAVKKLYTENESNSVATETEVENAREAVKRLYDESTLENTQRLVSEGGQREGAISAEQQRVREAAEIRNAMVIDKAAAQEARLQAQRLEVQDKVTLAREQSYRDHFEAFALARDLIALRDSALDREEGVVKENMALQDDMKEAVQQDKAASATHTRLIQQRDAKLDKVVSRRLDLITPGTFEPDTTENVGERPSVEIIPSLRQSHEIEPDTRKVRYDLESAEVRADRIEAAEALDDATSTLDEARPRRSETESAAQAIRKMKQSAARNGLVTLDSSTRAKEVADMVKKESMQNPERAIASQSQVSLQAALQVLQ
ncbi:MAG: hypothetical protein ACPGQS_07265 [Bradymonadia bacterium]